MTAVMDETTAKRIANVFRRLGSDFDGEVLASAKALKRILAAEGLSINDIATVLESCNGEIEAKKYSDADAEIIYERGVEKGRAEQQEAPAEFYEAGGRPRWHEIAKFCEERKAKLRNDKEREFVGDMVSNTLRWRAPTKSQADWLISIFIRLGGPYDSKTCHI